MFRVAVITLILMMFPFLIMALPGSPDATFAGIGKVNYDYALQEDYVKALAQGKDGSIIAAGYTYNKGTGAFNVAVLKLNSSGALDNSFGVGGKTITNIAISADAVVIQNDGKIIVAGFGYGGNVALVRLNSAGIVDPSFGVGGVVSTNFGGIESANAMVLQNDGKIVVAGDQLNGKVALLARYNSDGTPDAGFGTGGQVTSAFSTDTIINSVAVAPDGKILVAGSQENNNGISRIFVGRYNGTGVPDAGFGAGGFVNTTIKGFYDSACGVLVYPTGKVLVAGTSVDSSSQGNFVLVRYTSAGVVEQIKDADINVDGDARALALRPDGKIVIAGSWGANFGVEQFTNTLDFDSSFGTNGVVNLDFSGGVDEGSAVLIQNDGKILVGGRARVGGTPTDNFAFARFLGFTSPLLFDDFGDGFLTWNIQNGSWLESFGIFSVTAAPSATAFAPLPWSPSGVSSCSKCTTLMSLTSAGGDKSKITIYAWYQDGSNNVQLIMNSQKGKWLLKQKGAGLTSKQVIKQPIVPGVFYNVGLSFDGSNLLLMVDGVQIAQLPAVVQPSGNIGFKVKNTSTGILHVLTY